LHSCPRGNDFKASSLNTGIYLKLFLWLFVFFSWRFFGDLWWIARFVLGFQGFVVGADVSSGKFGGHLFCELGFLEAGAEPKAWRTLQWRQRRRTG